MNRERLHLSACILVSLGGTSGCASQQLSSVFDVEPVPEPTRFSEGRMVHEQTAGDMEVSFLADPVGILPFCVGVMFKNMGNDSRRVEPQSFSARDVEASTAGYAAALDRWKIDLEAHEGVWGNKPPRPVFTSARILDPEEVLAQVEMRAVGAWDRAHGYRAGASASLLFSNTDLQIAFSGRANDAERDFDRAKARAEDVRTTWLRKTDLAAGETAEGLVCMQLDESFAKGVVLRVPVGNETVSINYRFAR